MPIAMPRRRAALVLALALAGPAADAATLKTLHVFGTGTDGAIPSAALIGGSAGLFGTSWGGGTAQGGTVFELSLPPGKTVWTEKVLHSFGSGKDGANPVATLVRDAAGNLYGTAQFDGAANGGIVFELSPPAAGKTAWTETVLHGFGHGTDANQPMAGLVFDGAGNLYGTSLLGGSANGGAVFELSPPAAGKTGWSERVLHSFGKGKDGNSPVGGLIRDAGGKLYGTTEFGGAAEWGMVYRLTPPAAGQTAWTETVLHSFGTGKDGQSSTAGLVLDAAGALYGTTVLGGSAGYGTVFRVSPPAAGKTGWSETVLHAFAAGDDGSYPYAGVIRDAAGNLFGTTQSGGLTTGLPGGTVFRVSPPAAGKTAWTETVVYRFGQGNDGADPEGTLLALPGGHLAGTTTRTSTSPDNPGDGTAFILTGAGYVMP